MRRIILKLVFILIGHCVIQAQCTTQSNNGVDLEGVSISPIPLVLRVYEKGQIEVVLTRLGYFQVKRHRIFINFD
jgi:hypothetical protein